MRVPFEDIVFGLRDARKEAAEHEQLLLRGYFDPNDAYRRVTDESKFLVLGYKGSGKSALAQHMRLRATQDGSGFVRTLLLNELSFHEFAEVVPAGSEWQSRYAKVWALVLWLQLIDTLRTDSESPFRGRRDFAVAAAALESAGLLPARDLADAVRDYASHSLSVPGLGTSPAPAVPSRMLALSRLVECLREVCTSGPSARRVVLVIDGTDEIFSGEAITFEVVASLIEAASRMNDQLSAAGVKAKVVVLCRTDLFNRLPGSNKNKLRGDSGIEFNWFENRNDAGESKLVQLANQKARVADPIIRDIFLQYLPQAMSKGSRRPSQPTVSLLLDHTRHTPRDLLQLLTSIGEAIPASMRPTGPGQRLPQEIVRMGISRYSKGYFAGEIQDEVWGHLQIEERSAMVPILTAIGRIRFNATDFAGTSEQLYPDLNPTRLLEVLFDCSAIGNARNDRVNGRPITRMTFKYRNPEAELNLADDLIIHNGWRKKLNIVEGPVSGAPDLEEDDVEKRRPDPAQVERQKRPRHRQRRRAGIPVDRTDNGADSDEVDLRGRSQSSHASPTRRASRPQGPPGAGTA